MAGPEATVTPSHRPKPDARGTTRPTGSGPLRPGWSWKTAGTDSGVDDVHDYGDLLNAYQRADQGIRQDILRQAVPKVIERAVETVHVQVHGGVVELDGWLTRRSQVLALIARARATDGVVAVHSKLAYHVNDASDWASRDPAA